MADDRTEAATPRRRGEMRRRGRVAKSPDLSSMLVFLGVIVCLHAVGGGALAALRDYMALSLAGMQDTSLSSHALYAKGAQMGLVLFRVVGPFVLTALLIGVAVNMIQTGFLFSLQALSPNFSYLNPLSGLQRLVSAHGAVETLKAIFKLLIIGWIAYSAISGSYSVLLETSRKDIPTALALIGDLLYRVALRIASALLALAAIDYGYQRYSFEKSIRMTKQEVKEDFRQTEGSPQTRSRIRARQRQIARRRMMQEVPTADVVITNPTHFAVALRYDAAEMTAPRVVAKGAGVVAERIRALATDNGVPLVENPPLARALYKAVEIGREIPAEFYAAVAEVLAYVYQINNRRRSPSGSVKH